MKKEIVKIKLAKWLARVGLRRAARKIYDVEKGEKEFVELTRQIVASLDEHKN